MGCGNCNRGKFLPKFADGEKKVDGYLADVPGPRVATSVSRTWLGA